MAGGTNANNEVTVSSESAVDAVAITKSDSTVFTPPLRGIYVGGTGDVAVTTMLGTVITFTAVPAGFILPVYCSKVMSTNTSATSMVGLR